MAHVFNAVIFILITSFVIEHLEADSVDHDVLVRLEALEQEQLLLRENIQEQKSKNEELLKLLEDNVDIRKRLFLDGLDNDTAIKHPITATSIPPCRQKPQVGFHTRLVPASLSVSYGNVMFDLVETNVGNGYNSSSGYFVVPYAGNYEFILTLMSRNGYTYDARIMRDNTTELCRTHASSQSQAMGTCVAMVELPVDAMISVRPNSGSYVYGGKYTSFSGHLIN